MGLISIGGLGSGLDVTSIVDALVNAERAPKQNSLDRNEADVTVTLTGLGGLKSSLDELRSAALDLSLASSFDKRKVSISNSDFFTATATNGASAGNYDIEIVSLAAGSSSQSNIFTGGSSTSFGTGGTLTFTVGVTSFDVAVSATDTLEDIRTNINEATGNTFVSSNLLNNITDGIDTGSVLTFDSATTGVGNDLVVSFSGDPLLADLSTGLNLTQAATDASIKIDGFTSSSSTNNFSNVIQDITIDILKIQTAPGDTETLSVSLDKDSTKSLISGFVDVYNTFVELTQQLGSADENAPGLLLGDSTLRQVSSQIRNLFSSSIASATGSLNTLSSLGISTTREGTLEINETTLDNAIDLDFEKLDDLFTGTGGFATQLRDLIDNYTKSTGIISSRETSLNSQLERIADQRLSLELRIDTLQLRLTKQFAVMDSLVAQFNSTQNYIAQQFDNLPGFGGKKK